ncbi:hypothetical protein LTR99_006436 [Exophiala xenobiotica]|uniref:Rhodopsin domain-containing protein n=1 Tax=Vermiconidia calcicola TaxID=1690605 RepID=A0AAV9QCK9_9PEZI|nr:hypothetical protein LTR96_007282 [Exophiala xenobiotica]KAK5536925.1 hypothetical protein LTR23_007773 [Chaetothyriales sp. CCFEE 6169]KAK5537606.1 hypothetical protein LTR25_004858 [Vermiconidia calcicola]KAK5301469.1 hypothetical protein LTR99_006436 [Exophiala xenobiotica]KAK5334988.1 hypothetical protein LTR98_008708 [Exophiala xenobiotica]
MLSGTTCVVVSLIFTILSILFFTARIYTRVTVIRRFGIDDYLLGLSLATTIILTSLIVWQSRNGLGLDVDELTEDQLSVIRKATWATKLVYPLAAMSVQNAFLFQYRKLMICRWQRWIIHTMMAIVTGFAIASTVVAATECLPLRAFWHNTSPNEQCMDFIAYWMFSASFNTITALVVWVIPVPVIRTLHLPTRQKRWLMLVFLLGFLTCLAAGLRIWVLHITLERTRTNLAPYVSLVATWTSLEINIGIICACIPTCKPIVDRMFPNLLRERPKTPEFVKMERYKMNGARSMDTPLKENDDYGTDQTITVTTSFGCHDIEGSRDENGIFGANSANSANSFT